MGQRVNIQYSVELEDLEAEVNRLFKAAMRNLDFRSPLGHLSLGTEGIDEVDSLRRKLAKADVMLGDVQNIIQGYVRFKTQPLEPAAPETAREVEEAEIETNQLEDQIKEFKEFFIANSNQELKEAD